MIADALLARLLPVIDIMGRQVVHAVKGDRHNYLPLTSRLTNSSHPGSVALAFRRLGFNDLYVADLDALQGGQPDWNTIKALKGMSFSLWVDVGIRSTERVQALRQAGVDKVILALETLPATSVLKESLTLLGPEQTVFSLDLRQGVPLTQPGVWDQATAEEIVTEVVGRGIRHVVLLDVAKVGMNQGTGTGELCRRLHARFPDITFITGGGIQTWEEVREQVQVGATRVLVATAIHEGRLP